MTTLLCILDGFGLNPQKAGNATKQANMPQYNQLAQQYPHTELLTHGQAVGLPEGQMGNSEVGHMNIGAGRIPLQNLERIQKYIDEDRLSHSIDYLKIKKYLPKTHNIHLIGLVSDGGVHSHLNHIIGLAKILSAEGKNIYIHAITDGRDTAPQAAQTQLIEFAAQIDLIPNCHIADITGRFYAMDRDKRWQRTQEAYQLYTEATAQRYASSVKDALKQAYAADESDEFIQTTRLLEGTEGTIHNGDAVFFCNFRADRMRQLVSTFIKGFDAFQAHVHPQLLVSLTEYDSQFTGHVDILFQPEVIHNTLGETIANANLSQLRIAETEKYAHVTFFLNGGREEPFAKESRLLIPSPQVKTYDLQPEMSLPELTNHLKDAIDSKAYDLIVCNIANGDMVGHSGDLNAAIQACEAIDTFLTEITNSIKNTQSQMLITADHGNCEQMLNDQGEKVTSHSLNPVPLIYFGPKKLSLSKGALCDLAPTVLYLMGIEQPVEMTGKNLAKIID